LAKPLTAKAVHIACAANGNYLPHAATMLASLFKNNPEQSFQIHLLHDNSAEKTALTCLQGWVNGHQQQLELYNSSTKLPANIPVSERFSAAAWFRVLLPELLADIDRVLYLDVDLVVVGDITSLWEFELGGDLVAAVTNPFYPNMSMLPVFALGIEDPQNYFNSGVLLCDLDRLRRFGLAQKVFELAAKDPSITRFADQDPLNAILHGQSKLLHPKWNAQSPFYDLKPPQLLQQGFSAEHIHTARTDPAVIHYSGPWKPWQYRCKHPRRSLYFDYRQSTPWPTQKPNAANFYDRLWRLFSTAKQVQLMLYLNKVGSMLTVLKKRLRG
jgi:lipopolysaccharide biosynthesis glycosyltransferase